MKVAYISVVKNSIPPLSDTIDGIASISATIAEGIQKRGHQISFVRSQDSLLNIKDEVEEAKSSLPSMISYFGLDYLSKIPKITAAEFLEVFNGEAHLLLLELIQKNKYDLVHFHSSPVVYSLPFTKKIKIPKIFTLHDQFTEAHQHIFDLYDDVSNNYFVSVSNYQRKSISKLKYISTIYHGIDTNILIFLRLQEMD